MLRFALSAFVLAAAVAIPAMAQPAPFTPKMMASLSRVADPQLSPDGRYVLYTLRTVDYDANKAAKSLWLVDTNSRVSRRLAVSDDGAFAGRWAPDGSIYFLSNRTGGSVQIFRTDISGKTAVQVTALPLNVEAYAVAPKGNRLIVAVAEYPDCADMACSAKRKAEKEENKATGMVYDRLFVRHWGTWEDGTRNHLYAVPLTAQGKAGEAVPLMAGFDGDTPNKPFGGDADFTVSPDGGTVVFSAKLAGKTEPWTTNFDLWMSPIDGKTAPVDLTAANKAWDGTPAFSPDGGTLAYLAMKRPGFEADRFAIMLRDVKTGATHELAPHWDRSAQSLAWSGDGRTLYAIAEDVGDTKLFAIDVASGQVRALTGAGHIGGVQIGKDHIVYARDSLSGPVQLYRTDRNGGGTETLTMPDTALNAVAWGKVERFSFRGWNDETVHGMVVKPANFDARRKYPVAFLIHGGPQGSFGDGWSYRWNPQIYANAGYAVVMIDFHGSTGYGQAFTDSISRHWGDRPLEDLQKGWAYVLKRYPFLDGSRAAALGASYGGYMINWIAGNWNGPWKCLVNHDGVFDARGMGYSTEELWFDEWEHGGTFYDVPAAYEKFNPVNHVRDWKTPMLVIHGGQDFRIPLAQGLGAFTALQRQGIESKFLYFPDENHWVLKPQNSVEWHKVVLDWIGRWTKK